MDVVAELLELYKQYPVSAIEDGDGSLLLNQFHVSSMNELTAIQGYQEAFGLVSRSAKAVADMTGRYPAADAQIREGVRLLRKMHDDAEPEKDIEVLQALIESRLRPSWTTDQQSEYDRKKQILEWPDFFVSYTNRDAAQTNQQFRNLIKSCLGIVPKGKDNETNHLARVITRHLRRYQGLNGFFDEDELKVGESINEEVDQYCTKAFALVQLIEPLTFEKEPPRNWCFYEYQRFSQNEVVVALLFTSGGFWFQPVFVVQPRQNRRGAGQG